MDIRFRVSFFGLLVAGLVGCEKVPTFQELTGEGTKAVPPPAIKSTDPIKVAESPAVQSNPVAITQVEPTAEDAEKVIAALNSKSGAMTDQDIIRASEMPTVVDTLTSLNASNSKVTDDGIRQLARMPSLTKIDISGLQISGNGIGDLESLVELREVTAMSLKIGSSDGWIQVGKLSQIERLDLRSANVTDADVHHLNSMSSLKELDISNTQLTDAALTELAGLQSLEILHMNGNRSLNGSGLQAFARSKKKPGLRCLFASGTALSREGLANVRRIESLEVFENPYAGLDDQSLFQLKGAVNLKRLLISSNRLTSASGSTLRTMSNLEHLDLTENPVVNDQILAVLVAMTDLKTLELRRTSCTLPAVQEFRRRRKNCNVVFSDSP